MKHNDTNPTKVKLIYHAPNSFLAHYMKNVQCYN